MLTFHIREDVFWQDVPLKDRSAITFDGGHEIDGPFTNYKLNPVDVAFSFVYQRDNPGANSAYLMDNLDHVEISPKWASMWPYTSTVPPWFNTGHPEDWQMNFVQFNTSLGEDDMIVKLSSFMPWLGLHRIGGVPLIPMHVWGSIPMIGSEVLDAWGNDIVYGTGPYILLSRNPGVSMVMIPFKAGESYRGVTLQNSYFYGPMRVLASSAESNPDDWSGVNGYSLYFGVQLQNFYNHAYTFSYYFDYVIEKSSDNGVTWTPIASGSTATFTDGSWAGLGTQYIEKDVFILPTTGANKVSWGDRVRWTESFHTVVTSGVFAGFNTGYDDWGLWSDGEEYVHVHPGDVAGTNVASGAFYPEPYIAADGKCDIKDVSVVGANWQQNVAPGTIIGKNGAGNSRIRADINNDGKVDIKDVSIIGANWQKSWTP